MKNCRRDPKRTILIWLAAFGIGASASAQTWSFARIADTSTTVPGSGATFQAFNIPAIDAGTVAFAGFNTIAGTAGVYTGSGGPLSVIADRNTPGPGGPNFIGFFQGSPYSPSVDNGDVAFLAGNGVQGGIMLRQGTTILPVATNITPVPNGGGATFFSLGQPTLDAGRVVFAGFTAGAAQGGVYSWTSGSLAIIADKSTLIPAGSGTFTGFGDASLDEGQVAFAGSGAGAQRGVYLAGPGGTIERLYDTTTVVPGGNGGTFATMAQVVLDAGRVAFYANGAGQEGVYSDLGGGLHAVADHNMAVPGHPGSFFGGFGFASIDDGAVAFTGVFAGANRGVFSPHGGALGKVLAWGDTLDGKIVMDTLIGMQSLSGDSLALYVEFTDGSRGIYMATIPAPGTLVLVLVPFLCSRRRRA